MTPADVLDEDERPLCRTRRCAKDGIRAVRHGLCPECAAAAEEDAWDARREERMLNGWDF